MTSPHEKAERLFGMTIPCTLPAAFVRYVEVLAVDYHTEPLAIYASLITIGIQAKVKGCNPAEAESVLTKNAQMNPRSPL
jgi:hypothetical protein